MSDNSSSARTTTRHASLAVLLSNIQAMLGLDDQAFVHAVSEALFLRDCGGESTTSTNTGTSTSHQQSYTTKAPDRLTSCEKCQARKTKCRPSGNGNSSCQYCDENNLDCVYPLRKKRHSQTRHARKLARRTTEEQQQYSAGGEVPFGVVQFSLPSWQTGCNSLLATQRNVPQPQSSGPVLPLDQSQPQPQPSRAPSGLGHAQLHNLQEPQPQPQSQPFANATRPAMDKPLQTHFSQQPVMTPHHFSAVGPSFYTLQQGHINLSMPAFASNNQDQNRNLSSSASGPVVAGFPSQDPTHPTKTSLDHNTNRKLSPASAPSPMDDALLTHNALWDLTSPSSASASAHVAGEVSNSAPISLPLDSGLQAPSTLPSNSDLVDPFAASDWPDNSDIYDWIAAFPELDNVPPPTIASTSESVSASASTSLSASTVSDLSLPLSCFGVGESF